MRQRGGKTRSYFEFAVISYSTDNMGVPLVRSALQGNLADRDFVGVGDLFDEPLAIETRRKKIDDGAGGLADIEITLPIWYRPRPDDLAGAAPTCAVLEHCHRIAQVWCTSHQESFPPVVIHITDGETTDGDPEPIANSLRKVGTRDGKLLLFNRHFLSGVPVG